MKLQKDFNYVAIQTLMHLKASLSGGLWTEWPAPVVGNEQFGPCFGNQVGLLQVNRASGRHEDVGLQINDHAILKLPPGATMYSLKIGSVQQA
jgi:hypothetical protein